MLESMWVQVGRTLFSYAGISAIFRDNGGIGAGVIPGLDRKSRRRKSFQYEQQTEQLEVRVVPASISLSGTTLTIKGNSNWHDDAVVSFVNGKIQAKITSTPVSGFVLTPSVITRMYTSSSVSLIKFYGYSGNDSFTNNVGKKSYAEGGDGNDTLNGGSVNDSLYGGNGVDTLRGNDGNDLLHGSPGNDFLYGGDDNDDLYGDDGDDTLRGGYGLDGLYGGSGTDSLYGESGADRFLQYTGSTEAKDSSSGDAILWFSNTTSKKWTEEEIEDMDLGFRALHHRTGNDNLLELSNGESMTFYRYAVATDGKSVLADNNSRGTIRFYNSAFSSADRTAITAIHEIGHNWDNEQWVDGSVSYVRWQNLSGWKSSKPSNSTAYYQASSGWWYLKTASFARNYGKTSPLEDWTTAWESYFTFHNGSSFSNTLSNVRLSTAKLNYLNTFFNAM